MSNQWFRMYGDFINNPKVQILTEALRYRYVALLCLHCNENYENRPDDEIALSLRVTVEEWISTRSELIKRELLTQEGVIRGWEKKQYISDLKDPTAAERQQRYRDKKRNHRNDTVTSRLPESDTDTDTDTEKKKDSAREATRSDQPIKKIKASRATRLAPDWGLPQEWGEWAEEQGLSGDEVLQQAEKFKDRQLSTGSAYTDWQATWRNWIRNYIEWNMKNVQAKAKIY